MKLIFRGINFRKFVIFKEFRGINFREFEAQNSRKLIPRKFNSAKINPINCIDVYCCTIYDNQEFKRRLVSDVRLFLSTLRENNITLQRYPSNVVD